MTNDWADGEIAKVVSIDGHAPVVEVAPRCKNCRFWKIAEMAKTEPWQECTNPKFVKVDDRDVSNTDTFLFRHDRNAPHQFYTGSGFGCIHFEVSSGGRVQRADQYSH